MRLETLNHIFYIHSAWLALDLLPLRDDLWSHGIAKVPPPWQAWYLVLCLHTVPGCWYGIASVSQILVVWKLWPMSNESTSECKFSPKGQIIASALSNTPVRQQESLSTRTLQSPKSLGSKTMGSLKMLSMEFLEHGCKPRRQRRLKQRQVSSRTTSQIPNTVCLSLLIWTPRFCKEPVQCWLWNCPL